MSSRIQLAQGDFRSLGLHDADSQPFDDHHVFATVERAESGDSMKSQSPCEADEIYRLVNFFPDEVYELIRNWELTYQIAHTVDSMDTDLILESQISESDLEPMRSVSVSQPPPKRFFRTFWRSVTRRILQLHEQSGLYSATMSSSDVSDDGSGTSKSFPIRLK